MATTEDDKPVWLRIAYPELEMLDVSSKMKTKSWPLSHMRGYGQEKNCFSFDIGKKFPGPGHYVFYLQLGDDLFSRLDKIIAENAAKAPLASDASTPDAKIKSQMSTSSLPITAYTQLAFDGKTSPTKDARPRATSETPYTYVQTQTYVEVGMFTPQKPVVVAADDNGSNYVQVDIARTQALGKALRNDGPATPTTNTRKTRHDGVALPAASAVPVEAHEPRQDTLRPRQMSTTAEQQDDIDELLNSLDVQDGASPSTTSALSVPQQVLYENTAKLKHSYVNLPHPA